MIRQSSHLNIFIDTEFSKLPWEDKSTLLSIGIYTEKGDSYYAVIDSVQEFEMSQFVKENVLPYLVNEANKKTTTQISQEIEELLKDYSDITFWAQFPKVEWLIQFGFNEKEAKQIYEKYSDWDFQLFKNLWKDLPKKFQVKCNDITPLIDKLSKSSLPENKEMHHALSDAKWSFEVWKQVNKIN